MVALARRIAVILHRVWVDDTDFLSDIPMQHATCNMQPDELPSQPLPA